MRFLNSRQRLMTPIWSATGAQQMTPTEQWWKETNGAGISIPADYDQTCHQANMLRVHSDGTVDGIRLHVGLGGWSDHGGSGASDFAAGRM